MSNSLEIFIQMIHLNDGLIQDWNKFTDFTELVIQMIHSKLWNHSGLWNKQVTGFIKSVN